jgi:hypothetical protein
VKVLVPSIVDPQRHPGGAGTWTRGFISLREGSRCVHRSIEFFDSAAKD